MDRNDRPDLAPSPDDSDGLIFMLVLLAILALVLAGVSVYLLASTANH